MAVFFVRGLAVLALVLVSVFFGAAAFFAVVVGLEAAFFGAAAFLVVVAFGLASFSTFSVFSAFSAFGLASFLVAVAGFFSVVFFANLTGPEGPECVSGRQ